jgi:hypothetical protein
VTVRPVCEGVRTGGEPPFGRAVSERTGGAGRDGLNRRLGGHALGGLAGPRRRPAAPGPGRRPGAVARGTAPAHGGGTRVARGRRGTRPARRRRGRPAERHDRVVGGGRVQPARQRARVGRGRCRSVASALRGLVARSAQSGRPDAGPVRDARGRSRTDRGGAGGGAGGQAARRGARRRPLRRHGPGMRGRHRRRRGDTPPGGDPVAAGRGGRTGRRLGRVRPGREPHGRRRDDRARRLRRHPAVGIRAPDARRDDPPVRRHRLLRAVRQPQERRPGQHRARRHCRRLGPQPGRRGRRGRPASPPTSTATTRWPTRAPTRASACPTPARSPARPTPGWNCPDATTRATEAEPEPGGRGARRTRSRADCQWRL